MREERPRNAPRRDDARSERPPRRPFATDKPRGSFDRDQRPYRPSGPGPRRDDAGGDRPRRDYSSDRPARPYDSDRPRGNFDRDSRPSRPFTPRDDNAGGDRPRREFNSDRPRGNFDRDARPYRPSGSGPRRDDAGGDRPRRDYNSDRPARPYDSDRPRGNFDRDSRPARPFAPRYDNAGGDRPRREFNSDRPRGNFDRDARPYRPSGPGPRRDDAGGDRPRRDYSSDRPARPYDSDRPRGNFDRDSRPARPFTPRDDNAGGDRPRREFNSDRPRFQDRGRPERYAPPPRPEVKPVNIWTDTTAVTLSCARGLAAFVAQEAVELGYTVVGGNETMVGIEGLKGVRDILRLSLWLRTAHRVLIPVAQGSVANLMDLYQLAVGVPWESYISADRPFLINSTVWNDTVRDSRMPNLKTKDAIADRMREFCGRRPDSGEDIGGASIFVYWIEEDAKIYLDVSGRPLSKRGYRMNPWKAPMMESLAAAAVMATGWDKKSPFIVPMCGSGTPAIEAALIARNRAPGQFRSWFGFMGMKGYESVIPGERADSSTRTRFGATPEQIWKQMVLQARDEELKGPMPVIIAGDIDEEAVSAAQSNAISAGVIDDIRFVTCDFAEMPLPEEKGTLFINPEYGERLGEETELEPVYARIGDYFKQKCIGWNGCVFTGNLELAKKIRLRTSRRIPMFNGPIECRLLVYELFEGLMDEQAE